MGGFPKSFPFKGVLDGVKSFSLEEVLLFDGVNVALGAFPNVFVCGAVGFFAVVLFLAVVAFFDVVFLGVFLDGCF